MKVNVKTKTNNTNQDVNKAKAKIDSPWLTFVYAISKALMSIGWGYWAVDAVNNHHHWAFVVACSIIAMTCFADAVKLLLRADVEASEYYE